MINIIPLYILAGLGILGLGMAMESHRKPKEGKINAWSTLISNIIEWGLIFWMIYPAFGG